MKFLFPIVLNNEVKIKKIFSTKLPFPSRHCRKVIRDELKARQREFSQVFVVMRKNKEKLVS